ncbi:Serine/threonine-protein kinase AfsK [Botrimarina colliarenosi]|uniref:Serine/threonine-protein kinase AfsK n=1 Tax=Botrimarina colliarenosi TaxID=2528001 RepID=A0A5C6AKH9_9BACT|nr:PQQ-binding-like beta-propeller repeat protein [Botrimarina colliarenosi]TWT99910.1 Serine/threonine-protein kinase AfsK [Botrimarina colliarenosi]
MPRSSRPLSDGFCRFVPFVALLGALLASPAESRVVAKHTAEMAGLERAWFTQAALDPATQETVGAQLSGDSLYVLTSAGVLQAFDAETGATRWSTRLGSGGSTVVLGPTVSRVTVKDADGADTTLVRCAVTIGSTLHVLREVERGVESEMAIEASGSPASAPVLGDDYVYVPAVSGRLLAYPLNQERGVPYIIASPGQLEASPVVGDGRVIWSTVRGEIYAAPVGKGGAIYRFEAGEPLAASPMLVDGMLYVAGVDGVIHALEADRGRPAWRATVGGSVHKPIVVAGGVAFIQTAAPAIWAYDAATGEHLWTVEGLSDFVSATDKRVYTVTPDGAVGVLDVATGRPVASWPAVGALTPIANTQNDRLYFVSAEGLIQCFHEAGLASPWRHDGAAEPNDEVPPAADEPVTTTDEPADFVEGPADEPAEEPADAEPAGNPFDPFAPAGGGDDAPADTDDPFADFE